MADLRLHADQVKAALEHEIQQRPGLAPTLRTHSTRSMKSTESSFESNPGTGVHVVYFVTDTCYPTFADFNANKGNTRVDSAFSAIKPATRRAKKILYQSGAHKVDADQIIEEVKAGLYTGIGTGGSEEEGGCYARKCGVEAINVDEDSEEEYEVEVQGEHQIKEGSDGDIVMD